MGDWAVRVVVPEVSITLRPTENQAQGTALDGGCGPQTAWGMIALPAKPIWRLHLPGFHAPRPFPYC